MTYQIKIGNYLTWTTEGRDHRRMKFDLPVSAEFNDRDEAALAMYRAETGRADLVHDRVFICVDGVPMTDAESNAMFERGEELAYS